MAGGDASGGWRWSEEVAEKVAEEVAMEITRLRDEGREMSPARTWFEAAYETGGERRRRRTPMVVVMVGGARGSNERMCRSG
jgi:hypothetical protein